MKITDIQKIDRINLKAHYDKLYRTKFPWADNNFIEILVKHSFKETIEKMDEEEYIKDLKLRSLEEDEDF